MKLAIFAFTGAHRPSSTYIFGTLSWARSPFTQISSSFIAHNILTIPKCDNLIQPLGTALYTLKRLREILTIVNYSGILELVILNKGVGSSGVEQETLNLLVVGSNPTRRTKENSIKLPILSLHGHPPARLNDDQSCSVVRAGRFHSPYRK